MREGHEASQQHGTISGRVTRANEELAALAERFGKGDRRALARLISWIDRGAEPGPIFEALGESPRPALKVALTGSAGVGKSTLIAALLRHLRRAGRSVAVLASDPVSAATDGAMLGDRLRMDGDAVDDGVFIRSVGARGGTGVARSAGPIAELLERFGFDIVLLETIGAGQDQIAAGALADVLLLVLMPGAGDEVQWQKAGVMERADVIAVNKADLPGADSMIEELRAALELDGAPLARPLMKVTASEASGIDELWNAVETAAKQRGRAPEV